MAPEPPHFPTQPRTDSSESAAGSLVPRSGAEPPHFPTQPRPDLMKPASMPPPPRLESVLGPVPGRYGHDIKEAKGDRFVGRLRGLLLSGEEVLFVAKCNNWRPMCDYLVVTSYRLVGVGAEERIKVSFSLADNPDVVLEPDKRHVIVTVQVASMTFKQVPKQDFAPLESVLSKARADFTSSTVRKSYDEALAALDSDEVAAQRHSDRIWDHTRVVGGGFTKKASEAVDRQCLDGEEPWLIMVSSMAGVLAAFDDRLCIIKTGALTSYMAGSFGGERAATFHYRDITGVEYNSGMMSGVLEILTPSYEGTSNRDYWRGTDQSRNANSNDPFTLSNTLPLSKPEYKDLLPEIRELRRRIGASKQSVVHVQVAPQDLHGASLASEIERLATLQEAGALTDEEFAEAKRHLLQPGVAASDPSP